MDCVLLGQTPQPAMTDWAAVFTDHLFPTLVLTMTIAVTILLLIFAFALLRRVFSRRP